MKTLRDGMRQTRKSGAWVLCLLVLVAAGGCGRQPVFPTPPIIEGWDYSEPPRIFNRETLFHYMNGKARSYLDYGFLQLEHAQLAASGGKPTVDVDVYDMGSPNGAFGIYSLERGDELPLHYKKRLGYMIDSSRLFWKGRHYVAIASPNHSPQTVDAINALSLHVEKALPGEATEIPILAAFPVEGKIPESEQYFAINLMGYEFMGGGFVAKYEEKGRRFRLFLSPKESPESARKAYSKLKAALSEHGRASGEQGGIGQSAFAARDDYLGNWLVSMSGNYIVGAVEFQDEALARKLLAELALLLPRPAPPRPS